MDGIQKTVALALRDMATKVEEGAYGEDDDAFVEEADSDAFHEDIQDSVFSNMQ